LAACIEIILNYSNKFSKKKNNKQNHPVIIVINFACGQCLTFILFIIYKIHNKRNKNKKMINQSPSNTEITKTEKFFWIFFGSILDFISNLIFYYNSMNGDYYLTFWPSNFIFIV